MTHPTVMIAQSKSTSVPSQSVIKYRKQVIMMLGAVVIAFFVCLLPFRALTLWVIIAPQGPMLQMGPENYYNLLYFSRIMLYINSAVNPILYNVMSSKFRGGFLKLCGAKIMARKRRRKLEITRKSTTSSSANTSSQHTTDSYLKSQKFKDPSCAIDVESAHRSTQQGNLSRNVYVRAQLAALDASKESKNEIYV